MLSPIAQKILEELAECGELTTQDLVDRLSVKLPGITSALTSLRHYGLVDRRHRPDRHVVWWSVEIAPSQWCDLNAMREVLADGRLLTYEQCHALVREVSHRRNNEVAQRVEIEMWKTRCGS